MRLLVIGSGGREHALAWRLCQDEEVELVIVSPGNAGTNNGKIKSVNANDIPSWISIVKEEKIDLTIVGPEKYLVAGIVDEFMQQGLKIIGPSSKAAKIEASKIYTKNLLTQLNIPTAKWMVIDNENNAKEVLDKFTPPYVVKADGLAGGKGVVICEDEQTALLKIKALLNGKFGEASKKIIVEEYIDGEEYSLMAISDGQNITPLLLSKDYKKLYDNNTGPNTGGMGAVAANNLLKNYNEYELANNILLPVINELAKTNHNYQGFIYAGLIVDKQNKVSVLEFNCRLGDPEAQVILPLWGGSFIDALIKTQAGNLANYKIQWQDEAAVCVVICAQDYPNKVQINQKITINDLTEPGILFHANTKIDNDSILVAGGRVINIVGKANSINEARKYAYQNLNAISFDNSFNRSDIASNL